ncbi:MAG: TetR/AcrR family transcriptional regulator [Ilumatobacteraceae bacterium]
MVPDARPQPHGDVPRLVLDAALAIIETSGAETLSMREVARRAGVSHQAPYHYFGDRSGIFAAIAEEGFIGLAEGFRVALTDEENPAKCSLAAYVHFALEHRGHFRVMFRPDISGVNTHPATKNAADCGYDELMNLVNRTIGMPTDAHTATTWATLLWSVAHGLATLLIDGPIEAQLPSDIALADHIESVIELTSQMVTAQARAMGLSPA